MMGPCVDTTVEAQQSTPLLGPHCLLDLIVPPGKGQSPRALRCSSPGLALQGKDPGIKHPQLLVPCFSVQPTTYIKDYEICWP